MQKTQQQGARFAPPSQVERDTGLNEHQQREREAASKMWGWRVLWVMMQTGCSTADALRAVEDADREAARC
jgi:hypothetical protein